MKLGFQIECSIWIWPRTLVFSVGNGAMNVPRYWHWRNVILRDIGNATQWTLPRCWKLRDDASSWPGPPQMGQGQARPCWDKCEYTSGSTKGMEQLSTTFEKADTSAAYPYGAMNLFHSCVGHSFPLDRTFEELLFQTARKPTADYLHNFFYSMDSHFSSPRITYILCHVKNGLFLYRQNTIYLAKQAIWRDSIIGFLQNVSVLILWTLVPVNLTQFGCLGTAATSCH